MPQMPQIGSAGESVTDRARRDWEQELPEASKEWARICAWVDRLKRWPAHSTIEKRTGFFQHGSAARRYIGVPDIIMLLETRPARGFCPLRPAKREAWWKWKEECDGKALSQSSVA